MINIQFYQVRLHNAQKWPFLEYVFTYILNQKRNFRKVFVYTDAGMNVMLTAAYCNGIGLGVGGSVMVWGGIAYGYRTPLVVIDGNLNAQKYKEDILGPHVVPLL